MMRCRCFGCASWDKQRQPSTFWQQQEPTDAWILPQTHNPLPVFISELVHVPGVSSFADMIGLNVCRKHREAVASIQVAVITRAVDACTGTY